MLAARLPSGPLRTVPGTVRGRKKSGAEVPPREERKATPATPQTDPRAAETNAARELTEELAAPGADRGDGETEPPGPLVVFFPTGFQPALSEHPRIKGVVLNLAFELPGGGEAVARLPINTWPLLVDQVAELVKSAQGAKAQARASGIHLPDGANVEAEAAAAQEAEAKLKGDPGA